MPRDFVDDAIAEASKKYDIAETWPAGIKKALDRGVRAIRDGAKLPCMTLARHLRKALVDAKFNAPCVDRLAVYIRSMVNVDAEKAK